MMLSEYLDEECRSQLGRVNKRWEVGVGYILTLDRYRDLRTLVTY